MDKTIQIICHYAAGNGYAEKQLEKVTKELHRLQLAYIIHRTNYATHASSITQKIIEQFDETHPHIIVIGGDGTLHQVVNTLYQNHFQIPITYISGGTGNDFHRTWLKDKSIEQLIQQIAFNAPATEIPMIRYQLDDEEKSHLILNNMGFGFDGLINYYVQKQRHSAAAKWLQKFRLNYISAIFPSLRSIPHFSVKGTLDGKPFQFDQVNIATIINSPYNGGGIRISDVAVATNDEINFTLFHDVTLSSALPLFYKVLISKNQRTSPNVTHLKGQHLTLEVLHPVIGQVDGEVLYPQTYTVECHVARYPFNL